MAEPSSLSGSGYEFGLLGSVFHFLMGNSDGTRQGREEEEEEMDYLDDAELYVRYLLPSKNGYPLWHPKPNDNLPQEYKREGVQIGDVVVLNEFGGANFLFNVCFPASHEVNAGRVPTDFKLLEDFDDGQRKIIPEQHETNSYISSNRSYIKSSHISYDLGTDGPTPGVSFSATTPKGALLILPEGGTREDYLQPHIFASYAADCAESWYAYVDQLDFGLPNGALYLVTGSDKARAWGLASYYKDSSSLDRAEPVVIDFVRKPAGNATAIDGGRPGTSLPGYFFPRVDYAAVRNDQIENGFGAVFLRGFKIAIRQYEVESDSEDAQNFTLSPVYHPSDVINSWILENNGDVDIALTHDDDWGSLIRENEIEIPHDRELIRRLTCSKDCQLVKSRTKDGKVFACFAKIEKGRTVKDLYPTTTIYSRSTLVSALFVALLSALVYYLYPS